MYACAAVEEEEEKKKRGEAAGSKHQLWTVTLACMY
jgi:hypothetical protein